MHTIYLTDNGLQLKKRSGRILVKQDGKVLEEIPVLDLKRVLIFGNNQLSTQLMRYLASQGVEVAFLSSSGRFKFRLVPQTSKNIHLRMAQHDHYRDTAFRIRFGKAVVEAKLRNQRGLLVRYRRNRPEIDLGKNLQILKRAFENVREKNSVEEVMGVEGYASKSYFEAYGRLLLGGFEFSKREYHPPPDPINALLSFGYTLLLNELNSLLEGCGFDIFLGFLHSIRYGRASLATDMIEELRSPVIDRLVLYLVNTGTIRPCQFSRKDRKLQMNDEARKTFLSNTKNS
ncbi:MAG: CRISPR-associated endonuclease Cas1 [Desulfobacteraceae bacterium]|nr:MAG: CRISPR-associated endonuclease Cas1 [Desulfobacteraceae bacterium]